MTSNWCQHLNTYFTIKALSTRPGNFPVSLLGNPRHARDIATLQHATASVFCRSATASHKFDLRWILKTADPFFFKFGTIEDQPGAQKTVKRHFKNIICGHFYSKELVKFGKFVPFFDRSRFFFTFCRISLEFEACRSQQSQLKESPNTFLINIFYLKEIAFE